MYQLMSLPLDHLTLSEYKGWRELRCEVRALGCHGVEAIWGGDDIPGDFPKELVVGYHLAFYPDWLDFYREDKPALLRKFGSLEAVRSFYGGWGPERLLSYYREDLARARSLEPSYIVFHASDVSLEEGYTYCWLHSSEEVIETATDIANQLMGTEDGGADFLMENQWWPGFTFTDPEQTARLLDAVRYPRKGIMLDTGHLMNANLDLTTQAEGAAYIHRMLDAHGDLSRYIRGVHLHQSLSGKYVKARTGSVPKGFPADYTERFYYSYRHVRQIDRHQPWSDDAAADLVKRIAPRFLTHELSAKSRATRRQAVEAQIHTMRIGEEAGFEQGRRDMGAYAWYYNTGTGTYYWTESYAMSATQFAREVSNRIGQGVNAPDISCAYRQADMDKVNKRARELIYIG